jgi:hypothetical protein
LAAGEHSFLWNLKYSHNKIVKKGIYYSVLESAGGEKKLELFSIDE